MEGKERDGARKVLIVLDFSCFLLRVRRGSISGIKVGSVFDPWVRGQY